jgi:uncharacterized protein YcnI
MRHSFAIASLSLAATFVLSSASIAHVTLEARDAPADSYDKAVFSVPHGCEGSPTVRLRIQIPDGVTGVKPQPKTGWELTTVKKRLEPPMKGSHGETITETVSEVAWSGGKLLDEHFDQFVMQVRLPVAASNTVLYFPTVQECETGVTRWIEIPETGKTSGDYKQPAPQLRLTAKPNAH